MNVASVALGIAVFLAIQVANSSANRAFAAGVDLVAGKAHLEVRGDVDEALWPLLARQPGVLAATAIIDGVVTLPDYPGEYLRMLGVDMFSGAPFRTWELKAGADPAATINLDQWLGERGSIALNGDWARRHSLGIGSSLRALVNGRIETLRVVALIPCEDSPAAAAQTRSAAIDLGWAQELFGRVGRVGSVQLLLAEPRRAEAVAAGLASVLPPDLRAEAPRQRSAQLGSMVAAFQLNLTALSLVSLLVGVFLVYNTVAATVTRRRREIGILRALGATRGEVRALFLGEAALWGLAGVAIGIPAGLALAQGLTGAVQQTISSLYVLVSIEQSGLAWWHLAVATALGLVSAVGGAWIPANEAAGVPPVSALHAGTRAEASAARTGRWAVGGVFGIGLGVAASWAALHGAPPWVAFAAAFAVLAGFSAFAPAATQSFGAVVARLFAESHVVWRLAADYLARAVHRNAVTVAALASAVAMLTGLTVMIHSFRQTINAWIERGVVADLFIAPASNELVGLVGTMPPEAIAWLRELPGVTGVDTFREETVRCEPGPTLPALPVLLAVVDGEYRDNLEFQKGDRGVAAKRVFAGEAVGVSEPFARRHGVVAGGSVRIVTPQGAREFSIAGIYPDYTRDAGVILMAQPLYARYWPAAPPHSAAAYLEKGTDVEAISEAFRQRWGAGGEFVTYSNRTLRERIFAIFEQTFAVTAVLRTVALLVAFTGIFLSVTTLVREREREIGILRAVGATVGQVRTVFMVEAALLGLLAATLGLASGCALAAVLTEVVNPAFFGWSIELQAPWLPLLLTPVWITAAAAAAAWLPAHRGANLPIADNIREE